MKEDLDALASEIETAGSGKRPDTGHVAAAVSAKGAKVTEADLGSVEGVIHLVDRLVPGWSITIHGKAIEPDGHWNCSLREGTARDNDEFIGRGKSPDLATAILIAILRVMAFRERTGRG